MTRVIDSFRGEYEFLSNFFIEQDGKSVEHRFQASKALDAEVQAKIMAAKTPADAKKMGRNKKLFTIRPDWEQVKSQVMEDLVRKKFEGDNVLRAELLGTGDAELIEGNWWHDVTWGMVTDTSGKWVGENRLGKILMKVRGQLKDKALVP